MELRTAPATLSIAPGSGDGSSILLRPTYQIYNGHGGSSASLRAALQPLGAIPASGLTPQQICTAYSVNQITFGSVSGNGSGQTIAIVDAYDDPSLVDSTSPSFGTCDLARFDQQLGLPDPPSFTKLNETGGTTLPGTDSSGDWEIEESLDVEWAHAIAPQASIVLIECNSAGISDLLMSGAPTAAALPGVSVVSMSFGTYEAGWETEVDSSLTTPSGHQGVTFIASTGDDGAPGEYPAYSPNVVAVGGTSLSLNGDNSYKSETGWAGSGGGTSTYESEPSYQQSVQTSGQRTIPDVAFDADPNTGVDIYDSYHQSSPWMQVGGTSVSAPCWAGLIAVANQGRVAAGGTTLDGPSQTLPAFYSLPSSNFHDITSGNNGSNAGPGYDLVTGIGSPVSNLLIPDLAVYQMPDKVVVTAQPPTNVTAGMPFGMTVAVENQAGNVLTSFGGSLTVSLMSGPAEGVLTGSASLAAVNGVATFSSLTLTKAGSGYMFQVSYSGLTSATSTAISVSPTASSQLTLISEPPASVTAGTGFGLAATAYDSFGNVASGFTGNISLSVASGPAGGVLTGTVSLAAVNGVATFSGLELTKAGSGYSFQVSSSGLTSAMSTAMSASPAPSSQLLLTSQPPASVIAGAGFGLVATAYDPFGNVASGFSGSISVGIASGPAGGVLIGTVSLAAVNGMATFSGLTLTEAGSGYTFQVSSNGLTSATSTAMSVSPAASSQLLLTSQPPASVIAGAGFGLVATAYDPFGNVAGGFTGNISVGIASGPAGGVLTGTVSLAAVNGVATFSGLMLTKAGSGYVLQVSSSGLTSATSTAVSVSPAASSQLLLTSQSPASVIAGAGFGLVATAYDPFGNLAGGFTGNISVGIASGPAGGVLTGTVSLAAVNGVVTFSGLTLTQAGDGYTFQVKSNGLTSAMSTAMSVSPAAPSQLVLNSQPPASVTAGAAIGLSVVAEDRFGNVVPSFTGSLTVGLAANPSAGALNGILNVTAIQGTTIFSGLSITTAGAGYTLQVSGRGLASVTTTAVSVIPGAATRLVISSQPPATCFVGKRFQIAAAVEDSLGNRVTSFSGVLTVSLSRHAGNGRLGGTLTAAVANGLATFSNLTVTAVSKSSSLIASGSGLPSETTNSFKVSRAPRYVARPIQGRKNAKMKGEA